MKDLHRDILGYAILCGFATAFFVCLFAVYAMVYALLWSWGVL